MHSKRAFPLKLERKPGGLFLLLSHECFQVIHPKAEKHLAGAGAKPMAIG